MSSFRFEYYENVVTKHHLKNTEWDKAARWAFKNQLGHYDVTIPSIRMIDDDTIEIVKRRD